MRSRAEVRLPAGKELWAGALAACLIFSGVGTWLLAGGPILVQSGKPFTWSQARMNYALDQGPFGSLSNEEGVALVQTALSRWTDVESSSIQFVDQGPLPQDIDASNVDSFMGNEVHPENPVIFDSDGGIIDSVLGAGASNAVLGFAGVRFINPSLFQFVSAWAVINGKFATAPSILSTLVHEFGHLIGLDHTQANRDLARNATASDNGLVPVMYPFAIAQATTRPQRDDIAWISWLYPTPSFPSSTGSIQGRIFRKSGNSFPGANVVAVQVDSSLVESQAEVVSVVSDFLVKGDGSYELPGLPPGEWVVFIEPLDPAFKGGSGVGPFDDRFTDFLKDYYNGAGESGSPSDDPQEKVVLQVNAGQLLDQINLVANEGNQSPVAEAGADQTVDGAQQVTLDGTGSWDPDGDPLTFSWSQLQGTAVTLQDANTPQARFQAPQVQQETTLKFQLKVSDGALSSTDTVTVKVRAAAPQNQAPQADAGSDQTVLSGATVVLNGFGFDPDGDVLSFSWGQLSGPPVFLSGADTPTPSFVAPTVNTVQELVFELTVSDGRLSARDQVSVRVEPDVPANLPPQAEAGADQLVRKNQLVLLRGQGSDPEGEPLSFLWEQTAGPPVSLVDQNQAEASFQAPGFLQDTELAFRLTVQDPAGATGTDLVRVTVLRNQPPVLAPIPEHSVYSGEEVTLSLEADDKDGDPLHFQWSQESGPSVPLAGAAQVLRFPAPEVERLERILLRVQVSDDMETVEAQVSVVIFPKTCLVFPSTLVGLHPDLSQSFVAAAVLNPLSLANPVQVMGLSSEGQTSAVWNLPSPLAPLGQASFLTDQLGPVQELEGSVKVQGSNGPLQGFFLVGSGGRRLDGVGGVLGEYKEQYFPLVRLARGEESILYLFNPGLEEDAEGRVSLFRADGALLAESEISIPAQGSLLGTMGSLFPDLMESLGEDSLEGFLKVKSGRPLKGLSMVSNQESLSALPGQEGRSTETLWAPHYLVDREGASSTIYLLNLEGEAVEAEIQTFQQGGAALLTRKIDLAPGGLTAIEMSSLLAEQLQSLERGATLAGFIRIGIQHKGILGLFKTPPKVVGAIRFSASGGRAVAALPLKRSGQLETLLLHVSHSAQVGTFMGLAILNPGRETAQLEIEVFDRQGEEVAERRQSVPAGQRLIGLLDEPSFFGPDFQQLGGHLRVRSSLPVVVFALFGDYQGQFLAAVEGQKPLR